MELFKQMMDPNFKPIRLQGEILTGEIITSSDGEEQCLVSDEDEYDKDYIEDYKRKELSRYADIGQGVVSGELSGVNTVEDLLEEGNDNRVENRMATFDKYQFSASTRKSDLIIDSYKEEIISLINTNMVVIICGPTGCGKSTQVPQFILDDCRENRQPCNIVVTQPRKIAAISLARRVCEERCWSYGSVCGYQVALERETCSETLLTYVTTGVLLQKIIRAKNLHEYTHIIIDEVHERNQDMDFLLLIIRKFLHLNSIGVKIILMSATFDTEKFSHYFRNYFQDQVHRAPTVFIKPHKVTYNVLYFFAESLAQIGEIPDFVAMKDDPKVDERLLNLLVLLLRAFDRIELPNDDADIKDVAIGNVLIFLPGIYEIEDVYNKLTNNTFTEKNEIKWYILPLHSSIGLEEQKKVFQPPPKYMRKIILSTNIAESSLTVPDIGYVIDFCLTKTLVVDPVTQYQTLKLHWASQENCIQRAGRVGRVMDGRVYRLVTKHFFDNYMQKSLSPEILRAPLERIILASKMLELPEPPKAILALAIDPPDMTNIDYSIKTLKEVGGLLRTCKGVPMKSDGDLTFLGRVMSILPLDVKLSKLIVLGHMFSCLNDCIIMAAGCSLANIFTSPFLERLKVYTNKLLWADGSCSDLIAHLHLYKVWQRHKLSNVWRNTQAELRWTRLQYLSLRALREWSHLVQEIQDRLHYLGIKEDGGPATVVPSDAYTVLKIVMCGAFYPNFFKRSVGAGQIDEREAVKVLSGRDPFRTVYFKNMEMGHPGILYTKIIKAMFDVPPEDIRVGFDSTSKIYVEFLRDIKVQNNQLIDNYKLINKIPGKVFTQVYRAVKRRQLKMEHVFHVMPKEEGWIMARKLGVEEVNSILTKKKNKEHQPKDQVLPTLITQFISLRVTCIIDAGHFWAQNDDSQALNVITEIDTRLNKNSEKLKEIVGKVNVGDRVATLYDNKYSRGRVECLLPSENKIIAQVLLIDYGDLVSCDVRNLRALPPSIVFNKPGQAMECVLSGVQPSHVLNPRGLWVPKATELIQKASRQTLYGKVYSVVHGIVHLELYKQLGQTSVSLNDYLIKQEFAQPSEESFLSKENHEKRLIALQSDEYTKYDMDEMENAPQFMLDIEPPPKEKCKKIIHLKGPHSPLEMNIYTCIRDNSHRHVSVEGTSVNSVLLDIEPQDPHERLLVTAQINQSQNTGNLSLRNTTLMPNIHGLPALMALIFCPIMEPKIMENGSRIAEILCGLGTSHSNRPIYPEHDLLMTLDTELTQEEIHDVNEVRYWMNMALKTMEYQSNNMPPVVKMSIIQRNIYDKLMILLGTRRKSVERASVKGADIWKKHVYVGEVLQPGDTGSMENDVWPLHWTMELKTQDDNSEIKENIELMKDMAMRVKPMNEITCKLCKVTLTDVHGMRVHLSSQMHKQKETDALEEAM